MLDMPSAEEGFFFCEKNIFPCTTTYTVTLKKRGKRDDKPSVRRNQSG
jgi:hypothetical protein